ncbi:unnamed protein product [Rhodiola kirilowii]
MSSGINSVLQTLKKAANGINFSAYGKVIQHCADHHLLRQSQQLHARLILLSVSPGNFLSSKLVSLYSKCGRIRDARQVFDEIADKNTFSWNAMLIGYSGQAMHTDVLRLFSVLGSSCYEGVRADNFTITCVLKALSSTWNELIWAKGIHCYAVRNGFDVDVFVVNALVTCYSRCHHGMGLARRLFDRMQERDIVSWNAMIAGYSQRGYDDDCKEIYRQMRRFNGLKPNALTLVSVLQACAQSKDLMLGMEIHQFIVDSNIEMDVSLYNAVILMYAKCGSLDYARELLNDMSEKDEITYNTVISGYMSYGSVDEALELFCEIKTPIQSTWNALISGMVQNKRFVGIPEILGKMQASGFKPNSVTLSSILPMISQLSNLRTGKEVHGFAVRNALDHDKYVATAIIDTYAKSGFIHGAQMVFDKLKDKSLIIWTAIITAYASHGIADMALDMFHEMLNDGVQPDHVTFTAVLTACAHSGLVDDAWRIFNSMSTKFNIHPLAEQYACMIGVLSRAGRLSEAVDFISKMPVKPTAKVWGALLNGASVRGDVEVGKYAYDNLLEIEPECTGNYIIMANLYSQAGRWAEGEDIREQMNKNKLKKLAGCSWIETNEGVQNFRAKDLSNERSEEIYETLEGLLRFMAEEGYVSKEEELLEELVGILE